MKKTILIMVLVMLCLNFTAKAQDKSTLAGLKIGDKVPDISINNILNYPAKTAKLSDFKGRLVILDFWATWCSNCILMMPIMDTLQQEFIGNVQFISVTFQSEKEINDFFAKKKQDANWKSNIPQVVNDKLLAKYFPHQSYPHYVWIDKDGVVGAITSDFRINKRDLNDFLAKHALKDFQPKIDIDESRPLFSISSLPKNNLLFYNVLFKGHLEGAGSGTHIRKDSISIGLAQTNKTLPAIYQRLGLMFIPGFSPKRLVLNVKDSSCLFQKMSKLDYETWSIKNDYSYDIILPLKDSLVTRQILNDLLNNYTSYNVKIENRKVKCLELIKGADYQKVLSKGGTYLNGLAESSKVAKNIPVSHLINWLNNHNEMLPVIIDKTGIYQHIDIRLPNDKLNAETLRKSFISQGLDLIETTAVLPMLLVTDK